MKLKPIAIVVGALIASSISAPAKFGAVAPADAADAIPQVKTETSKIPEFVPVVNFSEFVMAMQTFAAENPTASRVAAEALSAKFALNATNQNIELHPDNQQPQAQPVIVTRPVAIASIAVSDTANMPIAPDPTERPALLLADPVKVATQAAEQHRPAVSRPKREDKIASTRRARVEKRFEAAMGLGGVIESAEGAPPITSLAQKKRRVTGASRNSD